MGCEDRIRNRLEAQTKAYFENLSEEAVREENEIAQAMSEASGEVDFDGERNFSVTLCLCG